MDPIDHRYYEWQHALHGTPAPPPQPGAIAPALALGIPLLALWLPVLIWVIA